MGRYSEMSIEKQNGIVYTPKSMAQYLATQMISFYKGNIDGNLKVLDPAIGDGELAIALISKLLQMGASSISLIGFETDASVIETTINKLANKFPGISVSIYNRDFVKFMLEERGTMFDDNDIDCENANFIIANPPYIRTQIMGAEKAQKLSQKLGLAGRVDIYYVFMMLSSELLNEKGVAGFITSNKFMTIKAGAQVRRFLLENTSIKKVVDFGDTHLFAASVLPCIIVFGKKKESDHIDPSFSTIYETKSPKGCKPIGSLFDIIDSDGSYTLPSGLHYSVKVGVLKPMTSADVWVLTTSETSAWLDNIKANQWKTFSDIGKIRVGIKTTADSVFIGDDWDKRTPGKRPELLRPLITHRNAGQIIPNDSKMWEVLYTHEFVDGRKKAVDLTQYPNSQAYLEIHKEQLASRKYIQEAKRNWYEIWVPQDPRSWADRKIVFRDISEHPMFWIDQTGAIVNGDCYWIDIFDSTSDDVVLLALAIANSPFIEKFYDVKFNNKLYSGKRRYMSQYVEQFPIPRPDSQKAREAINLVKTIIERKNREPFTDIKARLDYLVMELFAEQ